MTFSFNIPQSDGGTLNVNLETGSSVIFLGANGGGKTRLAAHIEQINGEKAHRIAAHRALSLNPNVTKVSESVAKKGLRFGYLDDKATFSNRASSRWQNNAATSLLNDYDSLLQTLFAEQTNTALITHKNARTGNSTPAIPTKFEKLQKIWETLLPHRELLITGDDIVVKAIDETDSYSAAEMSDGERAIFYLIGQTLVADPDSLLIFDEPELHVHRSILGVLWDELEAARQDCGFVFITHDIEFAASRDAEKYSIQSYTSKPTWDIEAVPQETGFSEEITTLILGSRKPVLFVEGDKTSLDISFYRHCIPDRTIIPTGSCEHVIHSVVSLRRNSDFTRILCSGLIDADDHSAKDVQTLKEKGIHILGVSEIENLILLPDVSHEIAICNEFTPQEAEGKVAELSRQIFEFVGTDSNIEKVVLRHCRRRIDRALKQVDLSEANDVTDLQNIYGEKTSNLDIVAIATSIESKIRTSIETKDLPSLLAVYDNKGLINIAATVLTQRKVLDFKQWLGRLLRNGEHPNLIEKIKKNLPSIE